MQSLNQWTSREVPSLTQCWYYVPRHSVRSQRQRQIPQDSPPPTPLQTLITSLGCYPCLWPITYGIGGSDDLGSINLLEWVAELRNSQMEETHRTTYAGRGQSFSALWSHHSPQSPLCSQTRKLSEPGPFGFLWRLHFTDMIDQIIDHQRYSTSSSSPFPRGWEWNWNFQHSNQMIGFLATNPHP